MTKRMLPLLITVCLTLIVGLGTRADAKQILVGSQLESGFDLGVNSSGGRTDWLTDEGGHFRMAYPESQSWGAVFVTVGKPKNRPRPFQDFSAYTTLLIEMKGEVGEETVLIGLKTNTQPDDGTETKMTVKLTNDWRIYRFPLEAFRGADPKRLYVVTEFVFEGPVPRVVLFRNISFKE